VDRDAAGRRFYLIASLNTSYPPDPERASGEFPSFRRQNEPVKRLGTPGLALAPSQPAHRAHPLVHARDDGTRAGSRWRANFVNYNQTSTTLAATSVRQQRWAPGTESQPDQWGWLTFGAPEFTGRTDVSPEAT
jgi:hypothetical protein